MSIYKVHMYNPAKPLSTNIEGPSPPHPKIEKTNSFEEAIEIAEKEALNYKIVKIFTGEHAKPLAEYRDGSRCADGKRIC